MKDPGSYANPINSSFQKFRTTSPGTVKITSKVGRCSEPVAPMAFANPLDSSPKSRSRSSSM